MSQTKQYIVLDEETIPKVKLMRITNKNGLFIECPCCKKLVRVMTEKESKE